MEDKEAIEILEKMLEKYAFSIEEKKAVLASVGILSWTKFGKSRIAQLSRVQKEKKKDC